MRLFVGDDWAEDAVDAQVLAGIETDRGPRVAALVAAGYTVYPVNPLQAARFRDRHGVSGAKSDGGDSHMLADMVRIDSHQLRPPAGDSPAAEAIKVLARTHKTLIWERTRAVQRLRHQLREYFPAALEAFEDLDAPGALEVPGKAPDPARAARLTRAQVSAALKRARRRNIADKADAILAALRGEQLGLPAPLTEGLRRHRPVPDRGDHHLEPAGQDPRRAGERLFRRHLDAAIYQSRPGLAAILGAWVLGEFGDDPNRYADGKARKNCGGTSPITRASGKKKLVVARFIRNDRLIDALMAWAFSALNASPGARAYYGQLRAKGIEHNDALRRLASQLVGILHGCLKTRTLYDEATAWRHRENLSQSRVAA